MARKKKETTATALTIAPEVTNEITVERETASNALQWLAQVVIENQQEYDIVNTYVVQARDRRKAVEDRRLEITRPMDAAKKSVMDLFRPVVEYYDTFIAQGTKMLSDVVRSQELAKQAAQDAVRAAGGAAAVSDALLVTATGEGNLQPTEGSYVLTRWGWSFADGTGEQAKAMGVIAFLHGRGVPTPLIEQVRLALNLPEWDGTGAITVDHDHLDRMVKQHEGAYSAFGVVVASTTRVVPK